MLLGWLGGKWFSREPGGHTALSLRLERPIWLQPGLLWRMTLYTIPLPPRPLPRQALTQLFVFRVSAMLDPETLGVRPIAGDPPPPIPGRWELLLPKMGGIGSGWRH